MKIHPLSNKTGSVMILALFVIVILSILAGSAFDFTASNANIARREESRAQVQALAEGCLEVAFAQWRGFYENAVDLANSVAPTKHDLTFIRSHPPTSYPGMASAFSSGGVTYTLDTYRVVPLKADGTEVPSGTASAENIGTGAVGSPFQPALRIYRYLAEAQVSTTSLTPKVSVRVARTFEIRRKAPWTHFASSVDTMEIFPGSEMNIYGTIHSNGRLYYGNKTLNFWEKVTASGTLSPMEAATINGLPTAAKALYDPALYPGRGAFNLYDPDAATRYSTRPAAANFGGNANAAETAVAAPRQEILGVNPATFMDKIDNNPRTGVDMARNDDTNPNNDNLREIIERPVAGNTDDPRIASIRVANTADIKILIDSTKLVSDPLRVKIYKKDYSNPSNYSAMTEIKPKLLADGTVNRTATNAYNQIRNAIDSPTASTARDGGSRIRDNREANDVFMTNVNVNALQTAITAQSGIGKHGRGFNGILYISDTSATTSAGVTTGDATNVPIWDSTANSGEGGYVTRTAEKSIRLQNGETFSSSLLNSNNPNGGFTVASDNAIYVQGNYNTGASPASNTSAASPSATDVRANQGRGNDFYNHFTEGIGYDRKPSLVAGDAVMVLSNNWNDTAAQISPISMSNRIATATTVNTAIVSGNVPSYNGSYSGGVENFPRFLEDWSGINFTYYGSMIQLFSSKQANGAWAPSHDVYIPPIRRWYFDAMFLQKGGGGGDETSQFGWRSTTLTRGRFMQLPPTP